MATRKHGYVALFDVLGFSDRVMRGSFDGIDRYINDVLVTTERHRLIRTILFSDTVVLFTLDPSDESFYDIVSASSELLYELIGSGIPVRGALSYGDFVRSDHDGHGTVIAGPPVIDAHYYESRLQWIGVMITRSVLEHRPDVRESSVHLSAAALRPPGDDMFIDALHRLRIQPCENIPLQDNASEPFEGFAIVPLAAKANNLEYLRDSMDDIRETLARLKQLAPDSRSQAKYRRSIDWLTQIRSNFARVFDDHITPPTAAARSATTR
jgi:hypothetical protein